MYFVLPGILINSWRNCCKNLSSQRWTKNINQMSKRGVSSLFIPHGHHLLPSPCMPMAEIHLPVWALQEFCQKAVHQEIFKKSNHNLQSEDLFNIAVSLLENSKSQVLCEIQGNVWVPLYQTGSIQSRECQESQAIRMVENCGENVTSIWL